MQTKSRTRFQYRERVRKVDFYEIQRMGENTKAHNLAEEVLRRCELEGLSIADMKDFAYILQAMIDKTLVLNEESHIFNFLHSDAEVLF